jgi:hypothetical protein
MFVLGTGLPLSEVLIGEKTNDPLRLAGTRSRTADEIRKEAFFNNDQPTSRRNGIIPSRA